MRRSLIFQRYIFFLLGLELLVRSNMLLKQINSFELIILLVGEFNVRNPILFIVLLL